MILNVVGASSRLYRAYKNIIEERFELIELSHKDFTKGDINSPVVVFGFSQVSVEENKTFLDEIDCYYPKTKIYIGSTASFARHTVYKYAQFKGILEDYVLMHEGWRLLRVGMPDLFLKEVWIESPRLITSGLDLINGLEQTILSKCLVVNAFTEKGKSNLFSRKLAILYKFLYSNFLTKNLVYFIDVVLKLSRLSDYGYTFVSNVTEEYKDINVENLIIGSGIIGTRFIEDNQEERWSIMSPKRRIENKFNLYESLGLGGNGDSWHGVSSLFRDVELSEKEMTNLHRLFRNKYKVYGKKNWDLLKKSYSYIPLFPYRPKRNLNKCRLDNLALDIKVKDDMVSIQTNKNIVNSKVCVLAAGSLNSVSLLQNSGLCDDTVFLDEHMVGYFGQITFRNVLFPDVKWRGLGHFKKFIRIDLDENRVLYVNIRPALFDFKDINKASEARRVFGSNTKNVIKKVISSFSLGLCLEAVYNKFGITLPSRTFNIVGHLQIRQNVRVEKGQISYAVNNMSFSQNDLDILNNALTNLSGEIKGISISNDVDLAPGLHYQNVIGVNRRYGNLRVEGSMFLSSSPEHPTLAMIIRDYGV